jgi:hypothetical protein
MGVHVFFSKDFFRRQKVSEFMATIFSERTIIFSNYCGNIMACAGVVQKVPGPKLG